MLNKTRLQLDAELRRILNWGRNEKDVSSMLRECAKVYREWVADRFLEQSQGGGDWEPLKPTTVAQKKRKGSRHPSHILYDSGKLHEAIKTETILGFRDFPHYGMGVKKTISRIKPSISIGIGLMKYPNGKTTEDIAEIHQYGTKHLPARPIFVPPPPEVMEAMASVVLEKMMEAWGN